MRRILSALPLSLLLAALPAQTESASQSPFRLVPADANFVVRMAAPAKWKQSFGTTQIAKLFQSQTLSPMVGMLEQNYQKALEEMRKVGGFDADLIDAMLTDYTGEMVFAVRVDLEGIEEMMQSGEPPEFEGLIAFAPGGNYDLAKLCAAIQQAFEKEATSRAKLGDIEVGGVKARFVDNDEGELDMTLPTMVDGQMVMFFGNDVEKQIQRATSGGAHFQGGNAGSAMFVHAEIGGLMKAIGSFAGMMADMQGAEVDVSKLLREMGLESLTSFDMSIGADGKHMAMEMEIGMTSGNRGLMDMFMPKAGAGTPKLVRFVPQDAAAFNVGTLDLGALYTTAAKIWTEMESEMPMSWSDAMAAFAENTKVRLKEDLLDHLGAEFMTVGNPPVDGVDPDDVGNPVEAFSQLAAGCCLCLGLKDGKAFGESLEKVRARVRHARGAQVGGVPGCHGAPPGGRRRARGRVRGDRRHAAARHRRRRQHQAVAALGARRARRRAGGGELPAGGQGAGRRPAGRLVRDRGLADRGDPRRVRGHDGEHRSGPGRPGDAGRHAEGHQPGPEAPGHREDGRHELRDREGPALADALVSWPGGPGRRTRPGRAGQCAGTIGAERRRPPRDRARRSPRPRGGARTR
jgi:hypothetical protein